VLFVFFVAKQFFFLFFVVFSVIVEFLQFGLLEPSSQRGDESGRFRGV
jgi:hypothetical protein